MEEITILCDRIKERMKKLGVKEFTLFTSDYFGSLTDKEIDEHEELFEVMGDLDFAFALNHFDSFDKYHSIYAFARKVLISDSDNLLFDVEERYVDDNGNRDEQGFYEKQTVEDILMLCPEQRFHDCLKNIYSDALLDNDYYHILELNGIDEQ
jgi:hypothetical protein